jgi:hypothetical protein
VLCALLALGGLAALWRYGRPAPGGLLDDPAGGKFPTGIELRGASPGKG